MSEVHNNFTLSQLYENHVDQGQLQFHQDQYALLQNLERLTQKWQQKRSAGNNTWLKKIQTVFQPKSHDIPGIYVWGTVGTGKTMIMDLFYQSLPSERKKRFHFHEFMAQLQKENHRLKGKHPDPFRKIALEFCEQMDVLCFDEFYIDHIADAMLIKNVFTTWFQQGILVFMTSNVPPENLYENGVNRELFLPFVKFLSTHTMIFELSLGVDFRKTQKKSAAPRVFAPLDDKSYQSIKQAFCEQTGKSDQAATIESGVKSYNVLGYYQETVWFSFKNICQIYVSSHDYLILTERFQKWFISGVPVFDDQNHDQAKRFRTLIDILYERQALLWLQCAAPLEHLNQIDHYRKFFERTESRIIEMTQSACYHH